ncbi:MULTISPECIES: TRAP transporter large permease subunit [Halomonadaceae]|jgi:tripartite ATP-independent transporter DctM subunit|uniref:TRAP transporter large permease subunit n=1 Tax=Halomonadaceae TaxID=28256 RepID=UPI000A2890DF|nr:MULTISPECIES: TRAP transporter large permease subunit [Halomonas]MCW4148148.1 TRAP transporter large permease subunit [Halomonas sp. 18H]MDR5885383.1 TRAP transporter large permease subunit [Halomonas janggokensis]QPL44576.1 TRAP transporter large permease subunit [Halomonas sp. A40-4]
MNLDIEFVLPHWLYWSVLLLLPLVVMFFVDRSFRRGATVSGGDTAEIPAGEATNVAYQPPGNVFTTIVDRLSGFSGRYVAYWALIAPFIFAYEVLVRYAFNSPTNWAHESMTLMFGMQYLIAGAYALREGGHVRVDILYSRARPLNRAALDIVTSIFFFIFTLALLTTGWTFFSQSVSDAYFFGSSYSNETSFTEWAIQFYPVKFMLFFGALLLLLQGFGQLIRDIQAYRYHWRLHEGSRTFARVMVVIAAILAAWLLFEMVNIAVTDYESLAGSISGSLSSFGIGALTLVMFGSLMVVLVAGLPLAFVTGGLGVVFLYTVGDQAMLNLMPSRIFPMMTNYQLSAIPLFIFMASVLEKAGIIEELFDVVYKWMGGLKAGLAIATIIASTLLAAMVGVIGAAVVTMGLIALPAMLKRNYDPEIAIGSIMAGGTLGILIPPSILAIIYGVIAQQSVGELYLGSLIPGLLLAFMYGFYCWMRGTLNVKMAPPMPVEDRVDTKEKLRLLRNMLAPIVLVILVLGIIFTGIATPVEAAGIGTFGALVVAAMHKRLTWPNLHAACMTTLVASAMVMWIIFGASIFVGFYILQGGQTFVQELISGAGLGPYAVLMVMMVLLVALGMFLDWVGILLLAVPIFVPLIKGMTFDGVFGLPGVDAADVSLWFGVIYLVNMQMSFLSPPFGYALFYIKGVCPPHITMAQIFRSSFPFLGIQALGLLLVILFPALVTWLPNLAYG